MPETTPLIKAALNLRVGAGFDVYVQRVRTSHPRLCIGKVRGWNKELKALGILPMQPRQVPFREPTLKCVTDMAKRNR